MSDNRVQEAVDIVAGRIAADAIRRYMEDGWGYYPEIGEHDWKKIEEAVESMARRLDAPPSVYEAAYDFLDARADAE